MTKIALLCPTRGRPEQCRRMIESAFATSTHHVSIHLGVQGDPYLGITELPRGSCCIKTMQVPDWPTVMTWNYLASFPDAQQADLVMLAADDMIFATPGWDRSLIEHYEVLKEKCHVYSLCDSRDSLGTPHPIVTREFMCAMGYFVPPIFLHWYVDTWLVAISKSNSVFTYSSEFLLIHEKPSDTGAGDETHNRIRHMGWHERDKFVNDTCQHFLEYEKKRLDDYLRKREAA